MEKKLIPDIIVARLPIYLLALQHMIRDGRQVTSSQELGERLGISSAQIRKDLSQFGEFGKQGTGYNIPYLANEIRKILMLDRIWDIVLVGAGDIGRAIAGYQGFYDRGFQVVMIFDNDKEKVGTTIHSLIVQDVVYIGDIVRQAGIKVAMIAVPAPEAQRVAEQLVEAGVKAILNYAPIALHLPLDIHVENFDPLIHLQKMTYYL